MQKELVLWYEENKRDFPWRNDNDPYHIWISEIMLQQTTTDAVIPYYNRFIETYKDIKSLSQASLDDVYKLWEGLGYYRRAKHILETAKIISEKYNGVFPDDYNEILSLKGIGTYTAGAISSISFLKPIPAVDGNVLRIISRYEMIKDNIALQSTQKHIHENVYKYLKDVNPSSFNQGLMDLGATICRPKNPKCENCPINKNCKAYKNNLQNVLPINIKKVKHEHVSYITGIISYKDKIHVIQNKQGLLENLFGFVQYDVESPFSFIEQFSDEYNANLTIAHYIDTIKHVFTHKTWHMNVYHFISDKQIENMYTLEDIENVAMSSAHKKVLKTYLKSKDPN